MYKYRDTLNGYHGKQSNSKSNINNRTKTNEKKPIQHVVKMINNVSTQNLIYKIITSRPSCIICEVDTEYLSTRNIYQQVSRELLNFVRLVVSFC